MKHSIIFAALLLAGCGTAPAQTQDDWESSNKPPPAPAVVLVATAPDGTNLWKYEGEGWADRPVYFSSAGTQTYHCEGKRCRRKVDDHVPNAQPKGQPDD